MGNEVGGCNSCNHPSNRAVVLAHIYTVCAVMGPSPDTRHVCCRVTPDWGGLQQNHLSETSMNAHRMPRSNNRCLWSDNPPKCHHAHMAGCTTTPQPHPDKSDQKLHHHHFGQTYNTNWHAKHHLMLPTSERYSTWLLVHCSNLVANHWQHACPLLSSKQQPQPSR